MVMGYRITLANGDQTEADIVVSAVEGVRPRNWQKPAALRLIEALLLIAYWQPVRPNVFTLGDCAEVEGHVLYYVAPLMAGAKLWLKHYQGRQLRWSISCYAGGH